MQTKALQALYDKETEHFIKDFIEESNHSHCWKPDCTGKQVVLPKDKWEMVQLTNEDEVTIRIVKCEKCGSGYRISTFENWIKHKLQTEAWLKQKIKVDTASAKENYSYKVKEAREAYNEAIIEVEDHKKELQELTVLLHGAE